MHVVSDLRLVGSEDELVDRLAAAAAGGAVAVHLREPGLPAGRLYDLACRVRARLPESCLLIVNDRLDIALAAGADGVQLGEEGLSVNVARRVGGPRMRIGRSVHSVAGAVEAARAGADYLLLGTIFQTRSHPGQAGAGVGIITQVRQAVRLPIIAIGGIDAANGRDVLGAGADGIAVISAILGQPDPRSAAERLLGAMV